MLGVNQLDFLNYTTALKGNYRKGVHKLRAIMGNPTHAAEFAANLGGVSVVLGVPTSTPDKNSADLLTLLLASSVADAAITTWLTQWYEFDDIDDLLNDAGVCSALLADPLTFRAVNTNGIYMGKIAARLAGLSPASYANMAAVAASSTAMTAVAASSTAMAAIFQSPTAIQAVQSSPTAWATFTGASSSVMGKTVAILAGLNPASYADMTAVAASSTAMAAVAASATARSAVVSSSTAVTALRNSPLKASYSTASVAEGTYSLVPGRCFVTTFTNTTSGTNNSGSLATVLSPSSAFSWSNNQAGPWDINAFYNTLTLTRVGSNARVHTVEYVPC